MVFTTFPSTSILLFEREERANKNQSKIQSPIGCEAAGIRTFERDRERARDQFDSTASRASDFRQVVRNADLLVGRRRDPRRPVHSRGASRDQVRSSLLADIAFRYPLAFCCSSDSGAQ